MGERVRGQRQIIDREADLPLPLIGNQVGDPVSENASNEIAKNLARSKLT